MSGPLILAIVGVFVAVAALAAAVTSWVLARSAPEQRRLRTIVAGTGSIGILTETPVLAQGPDPVLQRVSKYLPRSASDMSRLQRRLTRAGYPHYRSVIIYSVAELLLPVTAFFSVVWLLGWSGGTRRATTDSHSVLAAPQRCSIHTA